MDSHFHQLPLQPSGWPIVGHDRAVEMLRCSLRRGQIAHAYLFTGPPGVGKRTLALVLALTLNCEGAVLPGQALPDVPCLLCTSCSRILRGSHPDVGEINLETQAAMLSDGKARTAPAKELRIDIIREMQSSVGLSPYSGRRRVYILGDADRLNDEASNCLLKTLEEPPSHTVIVLLALDEATVLPTISSRCLHVPLRPLSRAVVEGSLVEGWGAEQEQASLLAALSGGRLGHAVRLLNDRESLDKRRAALEKLSLLSGAAAVDRIGTATDLAKLFTDARPELYSMLDTWEAWWRDVLMVKASAPELASSVDQMQTLASVARRVSLRNATEAVDLIEQTRRQLMENVNPRLALESLALGLP